MTQIDKTVNLAEKPDTFVQLIQGSLVEPESIDWIWDGWIARRKLHLIAGEPGTNKTTVTMALAAIVSTGGTFPDGTKCHKPQNIVIWSSEDDFRDTLLPRFIANGGDDRRLFYVDTIKERGKVRAFNPKKDFALLMKDIERVGNVGLVTIDSIADCTNGDSHKNSDTRNSLYPIVDAAKRFDFAALGVVHFNKGNENTNPLNRIVGSVGFGGMARIVFASAFDPDEPAMHRRLIRVKSNIGKNHGGFRYGIKIDPLPKNQSIHAARIEWLEELDGNAKELLGYDPFSDNDKTSKKVNEAIDFLIKTLSNVDMVRATEIERLGNENGLSKRTLMRAKEQLKSKIESIKGSSVTGNVYWYWRLRGQGEEI